MPIATQTRPQSILLWLTSLLALSMFSMILSISFGSVHMSFLQLYQTIFHQTHSIAHTIIFNLRMPRTLVAFTTGGLLALSGALMQTLLRNPLADPYVLGVSGGAAVATLLGLLLGITTQFLNVLAFGGSLLSIFFVIALARQNTGWSSLRLLLTGVVIATGWAAIISFILTISPEQNLKSMLFWLMGDLSFAHFSFWQLSVLIFGLIISLVLAKPLNILARGDVTAQSLGINTQQLNLILYVVSSLLTAFAVEMAGCIGFVGLIIPHMLRLMKNSDHRFILPASVLLGGSLLTVADTIGRSVMAPIQLPVGIVTAILGVPIFLLLLQKGR